MHTCFTLSAAPVVLPHLPRPICLTLFVAAYSSEFTCQNPKEEDKYPEHEDGIISLPIAAEHTKVVTVAVCEWTVNKMKEMEVTAQATLKGSTQVVW